jgi:hypothetical protein
MPRFAGCQARASGHVRLSHSEGAEHIPPRNPGPGFLCRSRDGSDAIWAVLVETQAVGQDQSRRVDEAPVVGSGGPLARVVTAEVPLNNLIDRSR